MSTPVTPPEARDPTDILDTGAAGGQAIRGSVLRAGGFLAGALVTLASAPLLFRHLGVVDFGRYVTVLSLVAIVAGVTEAGLGAVTVREYAALRGAARDRFMRTVLGARIVLTFGGAVLAVGFAVVAGYDSDLVLGTALASLGLVIGVVQATWMTPLAAGLRLGWVTFGDFARSVLTVVLVVVFVLAGAGVVPFLAITIPTGIALAVLTVALVRGTVPLLPDFHVRPVLALIRETATLAFAVALVTLYFRVVVVIMSLVATELQTGYFATSYRVTEVLATVPFLLVATTFPIVARAARSDDARLAYAMQRIFEIGVVGGLAMALLTVVGADLAVEFIGDDEAGPAGPVLQIQAIALVFIFINHGIGNGLLSLHMHREMLIANAIALGTVVVAAFALVPALEAQGAAIAVVVGELVLLAGAAALLWRRRPDLRVDVSSILPRALLATAFAAAVSLPLPVHDAIRLAIATAAFAAATAVLGLVPPEVRAAFADRLTSHRATESPH